MLAYLFPRLTRMGSAGWRNFASSARPKKTLQQLATEVDLSGKSVLLRADLNVPRRKKDGSIIDDSRVRAVTPTVNFLLEQGAKVIICSHGGQPNGEVVESMRIQLVAPTLANLLRVPIAALEYCVGDFVEEQIAPVPASTVLLLENLAFHEEETANEPEFAKKLGALADILVNDAFSVVHRAQASTVGVTEHMAHSVAGFAMDKELTYLRGAADNPTRPLLAMIGGSSLSTKISALHSLLDTCDTIVLGGIMVFTFFRALGYSTGSSMVEEDFVDPARDLMTKATVKGVKLLLPKDVVVADKFAADADVKTVDASAIPPGWMGLDIGTDAVNDFKTQIEAAKTIVWNGSFGVSEWDAFAVGTNELASALSTRTAEGATTIVGGDDLVAAIHKADLSNHVSHVSMGSEASLELLAGRELPGLTALDAA